ncbi:MAG TPA: class I SAM-dependent methyltransferase [Verrucomicrobiae bacterium]|nr:class I SAM-dependent methyltransferase [Verrucomicrobiae bacterium]
MKPPSHPSVAETPPRLRLRITAAAENYIRSGHPWVFADSVREQNRAGASGELAVIYDRRDKFLAAGFFDPDSPIRVRVLHAGKPQALDAAWWAARLDAAVRRRAGLFDSRTTGYRLINGESDGWPGLVLDCYDKTFVLKLYTAAWLPRLDDIATLIRERLQPDRILLRLSRNIQRAAERFGQGRHDGEILSGPAVTEAVVFLENGICFEADVLRGQKTGFFLDQRENRLEVGQLARGREVLNAFSFSGGFSLYAARAGAKSVTDLDLSPHALRLAQRNFQLNSADSSIAGCRHECVPADAFDWLAGGDTRKFGLIVLDPPSLAKREAERAGAIRAYGRLAGNGIRKLAPDGLLLACSCSAHVSAEEFFGAVRQAAVNSGRRFGELKTTRHAPDHPATFKEADYLKGIFLKFS